MTNSCQSWLKRVSLRQLLTRMTSRDTILSATGKPLAVVYLIFKRLLLSAFHTIFTAHSQNLSAFYTDLSYTVSITPLWNHLINRNTFFLSAIFEMLFFPANLGGITTPLITLKTGIGFGTRGQFGASTTLSHFFFVYRSGKQQGYRTTLCTIE